jgi:hypothetical protein
VPRTVEFLIDQLKEFIQQLESEFKSFAKTLAKLNRKMTSSRTTATPFEVELSRYAGRFARAIYVGDPPPFSRDSIKHSATMTLVRLPELLIGVTCHHVFDKYRKLNAEDPSTIFQIGRVPFDPIQHLIDEDIKRDLVTFDLTSFASEAKDLGRSNFIEPHHWPPRRVLEGDVVCLAGFPGIWRDEVKANELRFHWYSNGATFVKSANEENFVVGLNVADPLVTVNKGKALGSFGGLSGGPAFYWRNGLILHAELVGFISDYKEEWDRMIVRTARVLNLDGTFQYLP